MHKQIIGLLFSALIVSTASIDAMKRSTQNDIDKKRVEKKTKCTEEHVKDLTIYIGTKKVHIPITPSIEDLSGIEEKDIKLAQIAAGKVCAYEKFGCRFSHQNLKVIRNHIMLHSHEDCLVCSKCDYRALPENQNNYNTHLKTHNPNNKNKKEKRSITCGYPGCYYSDARQDRMEYHRGLHEYENEEVLKCKKAGCYFLAIKPSAMGRHMRTHEEPQFDCDICGKLFHYKDTRDRHQSAQICLYEMQQ
jgi:hypothetical protein